MASGSKRVLLELRSQNCIRIITRHKSKFRNKKDFAINFILVLPFCQDAEEIKACLGGYGLELGDLLENLFTFSVLF